MNTYTNQIRDKDSGDIKFVSFGDYAADFKDLLIKAAEWIEEIEKEHCLIIHNIVATENESTEITIYYELYEE